MGRIKKFEEYFTHQVNKIHEEDEDQLLRDLENIGMKERTYTEEMIKDVLNDVDFAEFIELETGNDFSFQEDPGRSSFSSTVIKTYFEGGVSAEFDTGSLWQSVESGLGDIDYDDYDDDDDETRYDKDEIEAAFDSVNWRSHQDPVEDQAMDDIEVEVEPEDIGDGEVEIEASATIDSGYATDYVDQESIVDDIISNL